MAIKKLTFDAKSKEKTIRGKFKPSVHAEREFSKSLRKVAKASGAIVNRHVKGVKIASPEKMQKELDDYAKKLEPWARSQAEKMLATVMRSNKSAYSAKKAQLKEAGIIGKELRSVIEETETGAIALSLIEEQVGLIQSLPLEAGQRAQRIATEAVLAGTRAQVNSDTVRELQKELGLTTEVAESRAKLIAITETARANAAINQSRAMSAGSGKYRWHNSGDEAVRHSHKIYKGRKMQGQIFSWDDPPTLSDGMTGHPGTFPRCRCFAEPVFED